MSYAYQILMWLKKRETLIFLALITALGFCLRIYRLDYPCLWFDELCTFTRVNGDMAHTLRTLKVSPYPPLYYIMMNIWARFFGFSEFSLRFPSMLFSTLSIIYIFFLAKNMFSEKEGLISALLLSISSYSINYSQEAKMYAMIWFLSILSFMYFFLYVNSHSRKPLILHGIFSSATLYTMYLGFIFLLVQNILFFCIYREKIKTWIAANILILLSYIPWWHFAIYNLTNKTGVKWIKSVNYQNFFQRLFSFVSGIRIGNSIPGEAWLLIALVIIAFIFSIYVTTSKKQASRVMNYPAILAWPVISIVIFIIIDKCSHNTLIVRYIGFVHIPVIIIFSIGITVFYHMRLRWAGNLVAIFLVASALYFHILPFHKHGLKIGREYWAELIHELCGIADKNSLVLTGQGIKAMQYYGKCFKGDIVSVSPDKITESYIRENNFDRKNYHSIFVLYRNRRFRRSDWVLKYQANEIRKGRNGYIQIPVNESVKNRY